MLLVRFGTESEPSLCTVNKASVCIVVSSGEITGHHYDVTRQPTSPSEKGHMCKCYITGLPLA